MEAPPVRGSYLPDHLFGLDDRRRYERGGIYAAPLAKNQGTVADTFQRSQFGSGYDSSLPPSLIRGVCEHRGG